MGEAEGRRFRVLVVEDDVDTLALIGKALTMFGLDGIPVLTCEAARYAANTLGGVDAVVCDLELPDGNGVALARELGAACGCPVAVMSGHPEPDEGLPEGIGRWLQKPVGLPELRAAIGALTLRA